MGRKMRSLRKGGRKIRRVSKRGGRRIKKKSVRRTRSLRNRMSRRMPGGSEIEGASYEQALYGDEAIYEVVAPDNETPKARIGSVVLTEKKYGSVVTANKRAQKVNRAQHGVTDVNPRTKSRVIRDQHRTTWVGQNSGIDGRISSMKKRLENSRDMWFKPNYTWEQSKTELLGKRPGHFLIRESSLPKEPYKTKYSIDIKIYSRESDEVGTQREDKFFKEWFLFNKNNETYYIMPKPGSTEDLKAYKNLEDIVLEFMYNDELRKRHNLTNTNFRPPYQFP
jgi:hypothetical protein